MSHPILESEIFYSNNPRVLLKPYSTSQLEAWFGPSNRNIENFDEYVDELLDDIWTESKRIDLISWDADTDSIFFDYSQQKNISLHELTQNLNKYSLMSLKRLRQQIEPNLERWSSTLEYPEFLQLVQRILDRENKVFTTTYVEENI